MATLLVLMLVLGIAPLMLAIGRSTPGAGRLHLPTAGSTLLSALAFNLVFIWRELGLAVPKAFVPGLAVILYHNDLAWIGDAPVAELLQGTGAIATLAAGLVALALLASPLRLAPAWRALTFWAALEGLFQSLSPLALGSCLPGNEVGRALAYLGVRSGARRCWSPPPSARRLPGPA